MLDLGAETTFRVYAELAHIERSSYMRSRRRDLGVITTRDLDEVFDFGNAALTKSARKFWSVRAEPVEGG